ncbi:MAG: hypothetical protein RLZZ47_1455 [Bacteroidota bacterium]
MLVINVKENDSLEKALKKFKKKFEKTGVVKELRARQAFEAYKQQMQIADVEG